MPQEAIALPARTHDSGYEPYSPSALNRIIVGTLLALGLYLALRKLSTGWILATVSDPAELWLSFEGLRAIVGFQVVSAVFGALLAAAGRPMGYALGAVIGGLCGGLFLAAEVYASGAPVFDLIMLMQPGVMLVAGMVAGVVGGRIWPTPPNVDKPVPVSPDKLSSIQLGMDEIIPHGRPTAWIRIVVGAMIMVAGVTQADKVRFGAQKYSAGALRVQSQGQGRFMSLQLATLAALAGAAFAGAGTGSGIRHGVLAGMLAGLGVAGLGAATGEMVGPVEYWLGQLEMRGLGIQNPAAMAVIGGSVAMVGAIGGWLGGTLFLPLAPAHMRGNKLRIGQD